MNIPADFPSVDQDNVYYSVSALADELTKYFDTKAIAIIKSSLMKFKLAAFVFDNNDAPNSYQIDVYPKGENKFNILLSSDGTLQVKNQATKATVTEVIVDEIIDDGSGIKLDSTFHSNSELKSHDAFQNLPIDEESAPGIDLIVSNKFSCNRKVLQERTQFLEFNINLLKDFLERMPSQDREVLQDLYDTKNENIQTIIDTLNEINIGEANSIGSLMPEKVFKSYPQENTTSKDIELTRTQFVQALSDLNNAISTGSGYKKGRVHSQSSRSIIAPRNMYSSNTNFRRIWNDVVNTLIENNFIEENTLTDLNAGLISDAGNDVNSLLDFSYKGDQKELFSEDGWLSEWYFDNFAKILKDESLDFSSLTSFTNSYNSLVNNVRKQGDLGILGGNFLLVIDAIKKSILSMCQSNLDVSEYAPLIDGKSIFTLMGRSSTLGPSGCHQFPSRYDSNEEDYKIDNFSKTGFLCFHALLKLIDKAWNYSRTRDFILENIKQFDSDHDRVIDMWDDISEIGLSSKQTYGVTASVTGANATIGYSRTVRSDKIVAHLYRKEEEFYGREIYLIPEGDESISKSERTFVGYNLRGIDHTRESDVIISNSEMTLADGYGLKTLTEEDSSAVGSGGLVSIYGTSDHYRLMGYVAPVSRAVAGVSGNNTSEDTQKYSRNERVHYGVINPENWSEEEESNNCFGFWSQKNYNLPYFWASMMSLFKGITIETYRNLLNSINDILETNIELTDEQILDLFNTSWLWSGINELVGKILSDNGLAHHCVVRVDGTVSFTDDIGPSDISRMWKAEYRNTPGDFSDTMIKNYIKFASSISQLDSVKIVEEHKSYEFDYATYVPPEAIAIASNNNFKNTHGGVSSYISNSFDDIYDPFEFRAMEFIDARPINKTKGALGENNTYFDYYSSFVKTSREMFQHTLFLENIINSFANMQKFIESFVVGEDVIRVFTTEDIDIKKDIRNPSTMIAQIENKRRLYAADENGIGTRWKNIFLPSTEGFIEESRSWLYIYVIGIKKEAFVSDMVTLTPEYIGTGSLVPLTSIAKTFHLIPQLDTNEEQESMAILSYLHLVRGLDLDEATFSTRTDLIYEDHLIQNKSGHFPWTSDDFEEGKPTMPIDGVYSMSPIIHPTNYFNNSCLENKYARVVAIALKTSDIEQYKSAIDTISEGDVINDIIGSVRFVTQGG